MTTAFQSSSPGIKRLEWSGDEGWESMVGGDEGKESTVGRED